MHLATSIVPGHASQSEQSFDGDLQLLDADERWHHVLQCKSMVLAVWSKGQSSLTLAICSKCAGVCGKSPTQCLPQTTKTIVLHRLMMHQLFQNFLEMPYSDYVKLHDMAKTVKYVGRNETASLLSNMLHEKLQASQYKGAMLLKILAHPKASFMTRYQLTNCMAQYQLLGGSYAPSDNRLERLEDDERWQHVIQCTQMVHSIARRDKESDALRLSICSECSGVHMASRKHPKRIVTSHQHVHPLFLEVLEMPRSQYSLMHDEVVRDTDYSRRMDVASRLNKMIHQKLQVSPQKGPALLKMIAHPKLKFLNSLMSLQTREGAQNAGAIDEDEDEDEHQDAGNTGFDTTPHDEPQQQPLQKKQRQEPDHNIDERHLQLSLPPLQLLQSSPPSNYPFRPLHYSQLPQLPQLSQQSQNSQHSPQRPYQSESHQPERERQAAAVPDAAEPDAAEPDAAVPDAAEPDVVTVRLTKIAEVLRIAGERVSSLIVGRLSMNDCERLLLWSPPLPDEVQAQICERLALAVRSGR